MYFINHIESPEYLDENVEYFPLKCDVSCRAFSKSKSGYCDKDSYYNECQAVNAVFSLCCVSDKDDSADEGKKQANNRAGENNTGAFSYFCRL